MTHRPELIAALATLTEDTLQMSIQFSEQPLSEQLDSMQRLSLMVAIEDHFEIIFEPEEEQEITNVDSLLTLIAEKEAKNSSQVFAIEN